MDGAQGLKENHKGIELININHIPGIKQTITGVKNKNMNQTKDAE